MWVFEIYFISPGSVNLNISSTYFFSSVQLETLFQQADPQDKFANTSFQTFELFKLSKSSIPISIF